MQYQQLTVDGARVAFAEAGQGFPLLLVHGMSGSARWWSRNIPALSEYFRVLAVELPGFGRSRGQPFNLADAPALLDGLLAELELPSAHVVGHSMGGYVASALAASYPQRVQKLVLVDAAVAPLHISMPFALAWLVQSAGCVPPDFYPTLALDALAAGPRTLLSAGQALLSEDLSPFVAEIRQPALILWGEGDTLLPVSYGRRVARRLSGAEWLVLPHAGHNPMWDQPHAFNRLVIDFLTRPAGAGGPAPAPGASPQESHDETG